MKELAVMADDNTAQGDGQGASDGASTADNAGTDQHADSKDNNRSDVPPEVRRALNKANKEAEGLRLRLKEFEDRDKTAAQKLEERAAAAERASADAAAKLIRFEVAAAKGLKPEAVKFLHGNTADEIGASADELLALTGGSTSGGSFDGGTRRPAPKPNDMNSLIRHQAGRG